MVEVAVEGLIGVTSHRNDRANRSGGAVLTDPLEDVWGIVLEYLKVRGYGGLYHLDAGCACELDDLAPCGEPSFNCRPGYKSDCDCGVGWYANSGSVSRF